MPFTESDTRAVELDVGEPDCDLLRMAERVSDRVFAKPEGEPRGLLLCVFVLRGELETEEEAVVVADDDDE